MTTWRKLSGPAVLVAALALSVGAGAQAPAPIDACKLLTAAEIAAATGTKVGVAIPVGGGSTADNSYSSTCVWGVAEDSGRTTIDGPLKGTNFVMLNAWSWVPGTTGPGHFLQEFRDAAKNNLIDTTPVPISLGDEALYWGDGVAVRKGAKNFGISVHVVGGKPTEQTMETALARKVLERL